MELSPVKRYGTCHHAGAALRGIKVEPHSCIGVPGAATRTKTILMNIDQYHSRAIQGMPSKLRSTKAILIRKMFRQLKNALTKCDLSGEEFLPSDVLHAAITKETVKAALPRSLGRVFQPNLASKIEQDAKKIFAILVLMGEQKSISELFSDGLRDKHLPLQRDPAKKDDNLLVSADGKTTFKAFANWDNEAKTNLFFDQQWLVQAPVMDNTGRHIVLDPKCALPFKDSEAVNHNPYCVVHRAEIHPAHIQGFEVHCPKAHWKVTS